MKLFVHRWFRRRECKLLAIGQTVLFIVHSIAIVALTSHLSRCAYMQGPGAYAVREEKPLIPHNIHSRNAECATRIETVPCHEDWKPLETLKRDFQVLKPCMGLMGNPIERVSKQNHVYYSFMASNFSLYMNKIVRAQDLIVRCPVCIKSDKHTHFSKKHFYTVCFRYVHTVQLGWPDDVALCELHAEEVTCHFAEVDRKKRTEL
ncbi:unnamed protein product [Thelazia callipaeda]|uniref:CxC5 domain-containing protein n=1 Tax=Thelazia callipaeda TaxID=103827 RepID=A0A0N5D1S8_THECL|nr:unnamed protein product [Thelazia callipaeda]